jgi:hypothetical protein
MVSAFCQDERKGITFIGCRLCCSSLAQRNYYQLRQSPICRVKRPGTGSTSNHVLRLLVPGSIDANIEVAINSNDGNFVPVGLSELKVESRKVINIPLTFAPAKQAFSIMIKSDQPILGSVLSSY